MFQLYEEELIHFFEYFVFDIKMALRTPMKKTQLGSRDLLVNGGSCPVEVRFH